MVVPIKRGNYRLEKSLLKISLTQIIHGCAVNNLGIIGLVAKFTKLLSENGFLSMIRMTPDDIYFRSLLVDGSKYNIETDLLVDSI